jgi:GTP-binding protein Era
MKVGFVTIIGRPNVGKSTLLNAILGQKVSIVSNKPNTTRIMVNGVLTTDDYQIVFYDTPGIHKAKEHINKLMVIQSENAIGLADVIYLMVTPDDFLGYETKKIIDIISAHSQPKFLLINKIDAFKKEKVVTTANKLYGCYPFDYVLPISAIKAKNLDLLINITVPFLKERQIVYNEDVITTLDNKIIVAEFVREQIYRIISEEVPYNVLVECEELHENADDSIYALVTLYVNRESQKGIMIGNKGETIKRIRINAKKNLEDLFGCKIYLDLWVKIRNNWMVDKKCLRIQGLL